ncbi:response regulator [Geothermobacter hydrogeniphilus]|uniref:Response regulatory domain-containing protein n=1 Tax=Geothermobacter hydrogeniphilus TaxID=1969733 RepID=A0A1X0XPY9_9BACT|nr:response regulator [Geothermobacter hydrogeniphilus]ORJ54979.1 hypothetical protein B5V00_15465 [Geothermobacter hydrogeniphilus]
MATLLLIDDVELFLQLEKSFLQESGHDILTRTSAVEVLTELPLLEPDLILLDLYMPDLDGDDFCRRLRSDERWQRLPVIMVTAGGKEEEIRRCLEAGCDDYLTKPVNKNELLEKVERLLGGLRHRTAERVAASLRVRLQQRGKSLSATVGDVSRNGIYVRSRNELAVGSLVEILLELPTGDQLQVLGKVKRVKPGAEAGMGIYFIHPEPQGIAALESYLHQQASAAVQQPLPVVDDRTKSEADLSVEELRRQNADLLARIRELEEENREFAEQLIQSEDVNNNLTNLYIASSRLHSVLDREQVIEIIKEVVINFVGAEKFALLLWNKQENCLCFEAGEGFESDEFPAVAAGEGIVGGAFASGETYLQEGVVTAGSDDPLQPLVAIPLKIHDEVMGVLAVYQLFVQKESFASVDHQLFSMMAEHAATALFSATLYGQSERKRKTYQGMMDLLLK